MKKKILILALLSAMILAGCGNNSDELPSFSEKITSNEEKTQETNESNKKTEENGDDYSVQTTEIKGWVNGLYENTTAQPIAYNVRTEKNVTVKQGIEHLTQEEINVAKDGYTLVNNDNYSFGPSTWETYKEKYETGFYEFPTPYNEGMWNAFSNIVVETDAWRLAIVTPEVWIFTNKTEEDVEVFIEPFVYNNACSSNLFRSRFICYEGATYDYGTSLVYYTPLDENSTLLGCDYKVGECINHGVDTVTFTLKERVDKDSWFHSAETICNITVSTNDTGPDYTLEDFSNAFAQSFTDAEATLSKEEVHTLMNNEYCSFDIERYSAQYPDNDNPVGFDTFLFKNKTDRELLIGFALYPEKDGELLSKLGEENNSTSIEFNLKKDDYSDCLMLAPNSISFYNTTQEYCYLPLDVKMSFMWLDGIYNDTNNGSADYKDAFDKLGAECPFVIEIYDAETKELLSQEKYYNTDTFFKPEMQYNFSVWNLLQA